MEKEVLELFNEYEQSYSKIAKLLEDNIPRTLKLFNIRLRLALDIKIDFEGKLSLTKSKKVRDTYVLLIKLMEIWNAYEALFHYAKEKKYINPQEKNIYRAFPESFLKELGALTILEKHLSILKDNNKKRKFNDDFKELIKRIKDNDKGNNGTISSYLVKECENIFEYFEKGKKINGLELIALIYVERNMYYHNGEAARRGMDYKNRQFLLQTLLTGFYKYIITLAKGIIDRECKKLEKIK